MRKFASTNTINKTQLEATCGMAYTISLIGGRWKLSILGLLLDYGKLRYRDIAEKLPGISDRMLVMQLKELERDGLISKYTFAQVPPRVEYKLSEKGQSLEAVLRAMSHWGDVQIAVNNRVAGITLKFTT
jgi:DNA-binding HxlR family transcriptional regulator